MFTITIEPLIIQLGIPLVVLLISIVGYYKCRKPEGNFDFIAPIMGFCCLAGCCIFIFAWGLAWFIRGYV